MSTRIRPKILGGLYPLQKYIEGGSRVLVLLCDTPLAIVWLCFSDIGFNPVHSVALIPCNITVPDDVGTNMHRSSTLPVSAV